MLSRATTATKRAPLAWHGCPIQWPCGWHAHGRHHPCACPWTQVTRLSLERDMLEAEYARMAIGSGRSAAERRRKVAPHTYRTHMHPAPCA